MVDVAARVVVVDRVVVGRDVVLEVDDEVEPVVVGTVVVLVARVVVVGTLVVVVVVVVAPTVGGIEVVATTATVELGAEPPGGAAMVLNLVVVAGLVVDPVVSPTVGGGVAITPATVTEGAGKARVVVARPVDGTAEPSGSPSSRKATITVPAANASAAAGNANFAHIGRSPTARRERGATVTRTSAGYSKLRGLPSGPTDQPRGNCSGGYH